MSRSNIKPLNDPKELQTMMTNKSLPQRQQLSQALIQAVAAALKDPHPQISWLAGDGSDRCYYRINTSKMCSLKTPTFVLMKLSETDAQALKNDGYDWVVIAGILEHQGIRVPKILAIIPEHASIIIEDYGDLMLETKVFKLHEVNDTRAIKILYHQAFEVLSKFIEISQEKNHHHSKPLWAQRSFDSQRFVWELNFFLQKFVQQVAKIELDKKEMSVFAQEAEVLSKILSDTSRYFVHRDLHSRNIMVTQAGLAIIDFQDARLGPAAYDLVSLIFDSYVPFTAATRRDLLQEAFDLLGSKQPTELIAELKALWKPMLLQRQLKAIGSFGYLTVDKGKGDYLKYVEPALKTLEDQGIQDERWPFISSVLPRRIRHSLESGCLKPLQPPKISNL